MMRDAERHYVLAPDRERGEAFYAAVQRWNHELRDEVLVFADGCFSKDQKLFEAIKRASFDQLILEGSFKEQIREDFRFFLESRELYEEANVPWRRGALLIGPPGNGKTLCVKALIRDLGLPCLYIHSLEARNSTPQRSIEDIFRRARAQAPCILVLEDIDALLTSGTRSLFLNELDGFAQNAGVITLATTNHPERLDPSIVERPSRFDRKYHFMLPSAETRMSYVRSWNDRLRPQLRFEDAGQQTIVELTEGFSFAYIQEVFVSTTMHWMTKRDRPVLEIAEEQIATLRAQMTR
jgi:SpoVK/Ycf46/Vps4 family AAA+-type ATPase